MRITVPSGNVARIKIQDAGGRVVLDVEWKRPPMQVDIEELGRLLHVGDKTLNLIVEDENRRQDITCEFLAGGDEPGGVQ